MPFGKLEDRITAYFSQLAEHAQPRDISLSRGGTSHLDTQRGGNCSGKTTTKTTSLPYPKDDVWSAREICYVCCLFILWPYLVLGTCFCRWSYPRRLLSSKSPLSSFESWGYCFFKYGNNLGPAWNCPVVFVDSYPTLYIRRRQSELSHAVIYQKRPAPHLRDF